MTKPQNKLRRQCSDKRQWRCKRKLHGYLLELKYGDLEVCRFVDDYKYRKSVNPNSFIEYHLIEMNLELSRYIFPMTFDLGFGCKYSCFRI